jgi:hypothetical protein
MSSPVDSEERYIVEYRSSGRVPASGSRWLAAQTALTFILAAIACTVICTVIWQCCVTDVLYHCTDSLWLDYLAGPGSWVHGKIVGQPGDFGDTIRPGWTLNGIKAIWYLMIAVSILCSFAVGRMRWRNRVGEFQPRHNE